MPDIPEGLSDYQMLSLLIGFVLPLVISVIQQPSWSKPLRAWVTLAVCVITGFLIVYTTGQLNGKSLVTSILIVLVAALATYSKFWKPSSLSPVIEQRTAISSKNNASDGSMGSVPSAEDLP